VRTARAGTHAIRPRADDDWERYVIRATADTGISPLLVAAGDPPPPR
jgi:hypothetical protein